MTIDVSTAAAQPSFYVTGGTLPPDAASYVVRQADTDLAAGLLAREYCYVLNSRQMGKSSLCVRAIGRLRAAGCRTVFLDLTRFGGKNLNAEQWYAGLLSESGRELGLRAEFLAYWKEKAAEGVGPLQRLFGAWQEIALARADTPLIVFVDEIDVTRSLPFSADEFFAAIRQCYVGRATDPALNRLAFCLLGVATPAELIQDTRVSPFNIGQRIELKDFTPAEAAPLAGGLNHGEHGGHGEEKRRQGESEPRTTNHGPRTTSHEALTLNSQLLSRVLYWTNGHPYLTQRLCRAVAEEGSGAGHGSGSPARRVDRLCAELFLTHTAREADDNLAFVRNRLLKSEADVAGLLDLYGKMRAGQRVPDDETNPLCAVLKLSGVSRASGGALTLRNRIYAHVFDRAWVVAHMPDAELRRQREAYRAGVARSSAIAACVALALALLAGVAMNNARKADANARLAKRSEDAAKASERRAVASEEKFRKEAERAQIAKTIAETQTDRAEKGEKEALNQTQRANKLAEQRRAALEQKDVALTIAQDAERRSAQASHLADQAATQARRAASGETRARVRAQRLLYPNLIARAQQALTQTNLAQAHDYLRQAAAPTTPGSDPRGFEWRYLAGQSRDHSAAVWRGHRAGVAVIACAPDGSRVASAGLDHRILIRDARSGRQTGAIALGTEDCNCLLFTRDGRALMAGAMGRVRCWDADTLRERDSLPARNLEGKPFWVASLALSPDESLLACGMQNGVIGLWDRRAGKLAATLLHNPFPNAPYPYFAVNAVAFSPDGRQLASGVGDYDGNNATWLWDVPTRRRIATPAVSRLGLPGWGRVNSVAFAPGGKFLVTGGEDHIARVWDLATNQPFALTAHAGNVTGVGFSPDGQWMATSSDDGTARLWDARGMPNGERPREAAVLYGHAKGVKTLAFSADSRTLLTGSLDATLRCWNVARSARPLLRAHGGIVGNVAYSRDGRWLATASFRGDNVVRVWDAHTHALQAALPTRKDGAYCAFSPDGERIACAGEDGTLAIYATRAGKLAEDFGNVGEPLDVVAWSPDGRWLAAGGRGRNAHPRVWDSAARREITAFRKAQPHLSWILALAFSPDSKILVSAGSGGELRWWDVGGQREIGPPPPQVNGRTITSQFAHQQNIFALAFSPDGRWLASGSEDNTARLWDVRTRQPRHLLLGHSDIVYSAAFAPDGKTLATGSKDGTVKLWSLSTLRDEQVLDMATLRGDQEGVYSVAFAPDGNTLACGQMNGAVAFWQADRAPAPPKQPGKLARAFPPK